MKRMHKRVAKTTNEIHRRKKEARTFLLGRERQRKKNNNNYLSISYP